MTPKQITAANRMLAKLQKIETELRNTNTAKCEMLNSVNASAIESNLQCQRTITMWLEMIRKNAA